MTTKHQKETIDQSMTDAEFLRLDQAIGGGTLYANNNGVLTPVNSIPSILQEYCHNLVSPNFDVREKVKEPDFTYPSYMGSVTGLNYRGEMLAACTVHQVWPEDIEHKLENPGIHFKKGKGTEFIGPGMLSYFKEKDSDLPMKSHEHDVCVFNFTKNISSEHSYSRRFFYLGDNTFLRNKDKVLAYVICGYPCDHIGYDVPNEDDIMSDNFIGKINIVTRYTQAVCEPTPYPVNSNIGICKHDSEISYHPDGFSGGPVFAITYTRPSSLTVKFAGVVTKFNVMKKKSRSVHFIKSDVVRNLLDHSADISQMKKNVNDGNIGNLKLK